MGGSIALCLTVRRTALWCSAQPMPSLETPRLRIHYEEAGSGPELFVLVHGNFASWRWWKPVLERLPAGWRAIAPDLRGCGETSGGEPDETRSGYGIPELAEDLAGFVD